MTIDVEGKTLRGFLSKTFLDILKIVLKESSSIVFLGNQRELLNKMPPNEILSLLSIFFLMTWMRN